MNDRPRFGFTLGGSTIQFMPDDDAIGGDTFHATAACPLPVIESFDRGIMPIVDLRRSCATFAEAVDYVLIHEAVMRHGYVASSAGALLRVPVHRIEVSKSDLVAALDRFYETYEIAIHEGG